MGRKRRKLVPDTHVEVMEVRCALSFAPDGSIDVDFEISDPHTDGITPPLHEVLGLIAMLQDSVTVYYKKKVL